MARILFFGGLRDIAGATLDMQLDASAATVSDLRQWLEAHDPVLAEAVRRRGVRIAVDQVFASEHTPISNASEIAFMPPFSGG